jgi:predicted metal-binding integral membrane protein DUF2182
VVAVSAETVPQAGAEEGWLAGPLTAVRAELGMVAALLAAAGLAWWWTADQMAGMDAGSGTDLGALGWFTGVWVVMMAAMMLPSLAPTAAVYAALARREPSRVLLFAGGYLLVWSAAGVVAYGLFELGKSLFASALAWYDGGRLLAAGVLLAAALYQLRRARRRAGVRRARRLRLDARHEGDGLDALEGQRRSLAPCGKSLIATADFG